jgi:hypothetical protein
MMDGLQTGASAVPTGDAAQPDAPDPKPVFEGDWNSASGAEKGRHSERVRQWRKREEARVAAEAQRRMAAGSEQPVARKATPAAPSAPGDAASRRVLEEIRDDHRALASDRIRATQALLQLDRGEAQQGPAASDLVTLREVLELLTPSERLAWLQGERLAHAGGGGS